MLLPRSAIPKSKCNEKGGLWAGDFN